MIRFPLPLPIVYMPLEGIEQTHFSDSDSDHFEYLLTIQSFILILGVTTILVSAIIGIGKLFTKVNSMLAEPHFSTRSIEEQYSLACLQEEILLRRLEREEIEIRRRRFRFPVIQPTQVTEFEIESSPESSDVDDDFELDSVDIEIDSDDLLLVEEIVSARHVNNVGNMMRNVLLQRLERVLARREILGKQMGGSWLGRSLVYLFAITFLVGINVTIVSMVGVNILLLSTGFKTLPNTQIFSDGVSALSMMGSASTFLQLLILTFLSIASWLGFHTLTGFNPTFFTYQDNSSFIVKRLRTLVNYIIVLTFSIAFPVFALILGLTDVVLLGWIGEVDWLGNIYIIVGYNFAFALPVFLYLMKFLLEMVKRNIYKFSHVLSN